MGGQVAACAAQEPFYLASARQWRQKVDTQTLLMLSDAAADYRPPNI
jgi:hypothetical protein